MKKENDMNKWTFAEYSPWLSVFNVLIVLTHIPCVSAIYRRCTCTILGTLSCLNVTHFEVSEIPKNVSLFGTTCIYPNIENFEKISKMCHFLARQWMFPDWTALNSLATKNCFSNDFSGTSYWSSCTSARSKSKLCCYGGETQYCEYDHGWIWCYSRLSRSLYW